MDLQGSTTNSHDRTAAQDARQKWALVVAILAGVWAIGGVSQAIAALGGNIEPLGEIDQRILGVFAYPRTYPRAWALLWTAYWGATFVAALACYRNASWGCNALHASSWLLSVAILLAAAVQHQALTFLEDGSDRPVVDVILKIILWAVALGAAGAVTYLVRRLFRA